MPRHILYNSFLFSLFAFFFTNCIEEYDAALPASDTQRLYVEGSIMGNNLCTFFLSRTFSLEDTWLSVSANQVSDAQIRVLGTDGSCYEGQMVQAGTYTVQVGQLDRQASYWLEIQTGGFKYESTPLQPIDSIGIESLTFAQPREDRMVDICITPETPSDPAQPLYLRWSHQLEWEIRTPLQNSWDFDTETLDIVEAKVDLNRGYRFKDCHDVILGTNADYESGLIRNLRLYSEDPDDDCFNFLYCTRIRQVAISQEEYEFHKLSKRQSQEMGGLFTPQPSELPSNITCTSDPSHYAIGYVGVSMGCATRELYIYYDQVGHHSRHQLKIYEEEELKMPRRDLYENGYRVYNYSGMLQGDHATWAKRWCLDATDVIWDASLVFPDYWPSKKEL